jgi:hypothetical protein
MKVELFLTTLNTTFFLFFPLAISIMMLLLTYDYLEQISERISSKIIDSLEKISQESESEESESESEESESESESESEEESESESSKKCEGTTKKGYACKRFVRNNRFCCENHRLNKSRESKKETLRVLIKNINDKNIRKQIFQMIYD